MAAMMGRVKGARHEAREGGCKEIQLCVPSFASPALRICVASFAVLPLAVNGIVLPTVMYVLRLVLLLHSCNYSQRAPTYMRTRKGGLHRPQRRFFQWSRIGRIADIAELYLRSVRAATRRAEIILRPLRPLYMPFHHIAVAARATRV
jgi:hypothetical protein